ncbi:MAG: phosphoglucosamine mutase [Nanoarchaeota archaeon]
MKLFGTDGVRGVANKYPVTAEIALLLGRAAAIVLGSKKKAVFLIGKDTRLSGYMLENAITAGLTSMGADVLLVGPMPTPAVAHLTRSFAADAGIMISASHNPWTDNGIKFFDRDGKKLPDKVEEKIEELVLTNNIKSEHIGAKEIGRAYRIDDAAGRYIEFAKGTIMNLSLKGLKIVLDCANGAAYKVAPLILKELGAIVYPLNNTPDGNNINLDCGALHPENVRTEVLKQKADLGITLDGDADRVLLVDENGNILDGDHILAMSGLYLLEKKMLKNNTIVVTEYTNLAFDDLIRKHDGHIIRTKNGDRYVIEEMNNSGNNLGGEFSGHIIFSDHNTTGDGMIAALQILRIMKEKNLPLSILSSCLKKYPQVIISVNVKDKKPIEKMSSVQQKVKYAEKMLGSKGRHLIRYSGTEMKARVMIEGSDEILIRKLAEDIANEIKKEAN